MFIFLISYLLVGYIIFNLYTNIFKIEYRSKTEYICTYFICVIVSSLLIKFFMPFLRFIIKWILILSISLLAIGFLASIISKSRK
ncbi:hypothetical protein CHL78_007780 [Romboutsia weinsteinii]|uniref:Uncharacterized protein n=1 Tax=Romboutsia weinsteinii TaxID=2020949 RepID=A0A371J5C9_9FIRM|nr:hypothetical protein CHL78_007780 [Romboutsia weinsteinii]